MRIFIAALGTESNSFSPIPTGIDAFAETCLFRGDASDRDEGVGRLLRAWRELGRRRGHEVIEGLAAYAQPGGPAPGWVFRCLRDEIVRGLRAAAPVGAVLLLMHGAMIADGHDDCEGDLLSALRAEVGRDAIIGALLDLHGNVSARMVEGADVLLSYKEYPHTDVAERAEQLFSLCERAAAGALRPVMALARAPMTGLWPTGREPLRGLVSRLHQHEREGTLAASLLHGFPYSDTADTGASALIVEDGSRERAEARAQGLAEELWRARSGLAVPHLSIDEALDEVLDAAPARGRGAAPVALAEAADNPDAGAAADGTFLLRRLLQRGAGGALAGLFYDPVAAQLCCEAGVGASLALRVGGKLGPRSGEPLDLQVSVRAVARSDCAPGWPYGDVARVSADGVELLLGTRRRAMVHPRALLPLGVEIGAYRLIALKSAHSFQLGFGPVTSRVLHVSSEGSAPPDLSRLPYRRLRRPCFPLDAAP